MCNKIHYLYSICHCPKRVGWYHCESAKDSNLPIGLLDRCERYVETKQLARLGPTRCEKCEKEYQTRKAMGIEDDLEALLKGSQKGADEGEWEGVVDGEGSSESGDGEGEELLDRGEVEALDGSGVVVRTVEVKSNVGEGKGKEKVKDKRILDVEAGRRALEGVRIKELEVPALKIPSKNKGKAVQVEMESEKASAASKEKEKAAKVETKAEKRKRVEAAEALLKSEKGADKSGLS